MDEKSSKQPLDLGDHLLWPDGSIQVTPDKVLDFTLRLGSRGQLDKLSVTELTPEILRFNSLSDHPLCVKSDVTIDFPPRWILPNKYLELDIDAYLLKLADQVEHDDLYEIRLERLSAEICLFKEHELEPILRILVYVIETLTEKKIVWGVGRGSSCSSYILYLMGLHQVDPVKFEISISDFIR